MRILTFFIFLFVTAHTLAQVKINEFTIDPDQSAELINIGSSSVNISGWYIDDNGGTTYFTIPENQILYPNSCLVFTGSFSLNKSSADSIRLFDNSSPPTGSPNLIDSHSYSASPGINISFARIPDGTGNFATSSGTLGKFNSSNQSCIVTPTPTPTLAPTITSPSVTPTTSPTIENVYLSEIMVSPDTGESEWVELYNSNDFPVELTNWFIDDVENSGGQPSTFSISIPAKSYKAFDLKSSLFNNSGDSVRLLDSSKVDKDKIEYSSSEKELTWGRNNFLTKDICLQEPSREKENNACIEEDEEEEESLAKVVVKVTPTKNSSSTVNNQKAISSINAKSNTTSNGVVLGETSFNPTKSGNPLIKLLSTLSITYSTLTLTSILLRIKFNA